MFQLRFLERVRPDAGKAERSQTTGRLLVTLPKLREDTVLTGKPKSTHPKDHSNLEINHIPNENDYSNIVQDLKDMPPLEEIN